MSKRKTNPVDVVCQKCGGVRQVQEEHALKGASPHCPTCAQRVRNEKYASHSPERKARLRRNIILAARVPRPASQPTTAMPGTPEKIQVMRQRYERGEEVLHPQDAGAFSLQSRMMLWLNALAEEAA